MTKNKKKYTPLISDDLNSERIPEEFPEGPFGSDIKASIETHNKNQAQMSSYRYPDTKEQQYVPRHYPISDPLRDDDE